MLEHFVERKHLIYEEWNTGWFWGSIRSNITPILQFHEILDELRKFTVGDFPKQLHLGCTLITLFFPTPFNQSTLHQNVFVLTALNHAIAGWKTMSKCGSIRGWRKNIKRSICAQNVSALENHLWWIFWVCPKKKLHIT